MKQLKNNRSNIDHSPSKVSKTNANFAVLVCCAATNTYIQALKIRPTLRKIRSRIE